MSLYKQPGSDIWWASVTINGERVRRSTEEYDLKAAQRFHDKLKAKRHDAPVLKGKKWSDAVMKWTEAETRSDSDILSLAKFADHYPDRLLSSVTSDSIDKALRGMCRSDGTYNRYRARISAVLTLSRVKLDLVRRRDADPGVRTHLTHQQWEKLYAELPVHLKASALFAVSTGLRQANVLGLTWDRVDVARRQAWVDSGDSKSGNAISVPLNAGALAALSDVAGQHDVWCFTFRGKPYAEIKTAFQAACVRAGVGFITVDKGKKPGVHRALYKGFTWHGLRHTWATWHVQNGTPLEVLQKLGGWSDLRMVMNYAKFDPGFVARYADNTGVKK